MLSLRRFYWWVGPVVRHDVCFYPTPGATVRLVCVWLSSSCPQVGVCLHTASTYGTMLDGLWPRAYLRGMQVHKRIWGYGILCQ